jgi:hypothetical protein
VLPLFFEINGILYTGPIADVLSGIVAVIMVIFEFRNMHRMSLAEDCAK